MNKLIAQHYLIQKKLGIGGMGTVYLGQDTRTEETVAIKQLKPDLAHDDMLERFKREGEALRDLNHPNIVKMLDAVEDDGQHYLIMEYVSGGDLSDLLKEGQLPLEKILTLSIDLADALTRAHKLDIIHRDLKPANILVTDDGTLKLTDFGVAHIGSQERVTETGSVVGTIDYLPPEVFDTGTCDTRGDIWAFGVMLFEMLTGERPFVGESVGLVIRGILSNPVPDIEELRDDIPVAIGDLVYRMLEKDPQQRISSVRIVGAELEAILRGDRSDIMIPRFQTPASETISIVKHNLPHQSTEFVGRESEQNDLSQLLAQAQNRLVTIVAQGGMGKTRLSLQVAETQLENFGDGVYFIELAPISDTGQIIPALAGAINYQFQTDGRGQMEQLLQFLDSKQMLIVMDNFEHIMTGVPVVEAILRQTGTVKILATSRQRLALSGETVYALDGLDFPDRHTSQQALDYSSVQLFIKHAQRIQFGFEADDETLNSIVRICQMVQGMPLGIVLAASWLSMLSPPEIVQELKTGMDILEDEIGELPDRQHSIRAVMDYSWQNMSEDERDVFMKLSVFRGGFTRDAAQTVAGGTLRVLMGLVNQAILRRNPDSGRYFIHELLRQYAEEQLIASGLADETKNSHATYYATLVNQAVPGLKGKNQIATINQFESELDNVIESWQYLTDKHLDETITQMLEGLTIYGFFRSWKTQIEEAFDYTRQQWDVYSKRDTLLHNQLIVRFPDRTRDRLQDLEIALALAEKEGNQPEINYCKHQIGVILSHQHADAPLISAGDNSTRGIALLRVCIADYRERNEEFYLAVALDDLGWGMGVANLVGERISILTETASIRHRIGDHVGTARGANGVATTQHIIPEAITTLQEGLDISRAIQDHYGTAWTQSMLAMSLLYNGEIEQARTYLEKSIELANAYYIEDIVRFAPFALMSLRLIQGEDPAIIEQEIKQIIPDGMESLNDAPAVYFAGLHIHIILYAFRHKPLFYDVLNRLINMRFGRHFMNWVVPLMGLWLAEENPQRAFLYLEYGMRNQDYGTRWVFHSERIMQVYNKLSQVFTRESAPELWQQIESLEQEILLQETRDYAAANATKA